MENLQAMLHLLSIHSMANEVSEIMQKLNRKQTLLVRIICKLVMKMFDD